jgi:hypothetical protein
MSTPMCPSAARNWGSPGEAAHCATVIGGDNGFTASGGAVLRFSCRKTLSLYQKVICKFLSAPQIGMCGAAVADGMCRCAVVWLSDYQRRLG